MKIKTAFKIMILTLIVSVVGSVIVTKRCINPLQEPSENAYLLPSDSYQPPLVKVPFLTKDRAPVSKKNLPIRKRDVKTTIVIKNPVPGAKDITIIIDKKGKVYKSKDTPEDAKIQVTEWKPTLFGLQSKWGIGIAMDIPPDLSFILSWDTVRIWKLHLGVDVGGKLASYGVMDFWVGTSVKCKILKNNNLFALAGYNWMEKTPYVGVSLRF